MNFESIIDAILRAEQGYVDHPDDRGGPTNHGITLAVARANGYDGGSRGAGTGTSNYVVFPGNENLLRILERNGQALP